MNREIKPDYSKSFLFPPALEDWVTEDHPARFVREFVESLDLAALGFCEEPQIEGRPRYADELLLKIWILGYFNDIRSSRKLERACREMVGFLWLTAMHAPDHNTLWRFFHRHGDAIAQVFVQTTHLARKLGLVGMVNHAVDGTKIRGRGSDDAVQRRRDLDRALAAEEKRIAEFMKDVSRAEEEETGQYKLPEEVKDAEKRKQWIREQLAEMESAGRNSTQSSDPDAREMRCDGGKHFGYNAQAVVDLESGVVVAADITNEQNDMHQLGPMTRQVEDNLGSTAENTLADAGYVTLEQLGEVEKDGTNVTVALPSKYMARSGDSPFHVSNFKFDEIKDVVVCPLGKELRFNGTKTPRTGNFRVRVYRCTYSKGCPERRQCCPKKTPRTIAISPHHKALEGQREKANDPEVRLESNRLRAGVETLFGQVKENSGFRRFTAWGLQGARSQWAMVCIAVNLRKVYKAWAATGPGI